MAFVSAVGHRLSQPREEWLTSLAEAVEELRERHDDFDIEALTGSDVFVDAVVMATRTIEHTHQAEKVDALRNAVLNSVAADAPDADTQAMFFSLLDRFTPSHLRLLALLDDPPAWFASHGIPVPRAGMAGSRTRTVETGLPEMAGRADFYNLVAAELSSAGLLNVATLIGMVSPTAMMDRLTSGLGRQFLQFITAR